jgi:hypothetical protein
VSAPALAATKEHPNVTASYDDYELPVAFDVVKAMQADGQYNFTGKSWRAQLSGWKTVLLPSH